MTPLHDPMWWFSSACAVFILLGSVRRICAWSRSHPIRAMRKVNSGMPQGGPVLSRGRPRR